MQSLRSSLKLIAITLVLIALLGIFMPSAAFAAPAQQLPAATFREALGVVTDDESVDDSDETSEDAQKDIPLRGATRSQATITIYEQVTPTTPSLETNVWSLLDMILVIIMFGLTIVMLITYPIRRLTKPIYRFGQGELVVYRKRHLLRLLSIPITATSAAVFFGNENPSYQMVWAESCTSFFVVATILIIILFLVTMSLSIVDNKPNNHLIGK
jgi:hypothetical protein